MTYTAVNNPGGGGGGGVGQLSIPVNEDLANLDALAAGSERVLHGLPAADDGHPTQALGKVHAHILLARGCGHCLLCERQMPQTSLHHLRTSPKYQPEVYLVPSAAEPNVDHHQIDCPMPRMCT